MTVDQLATKTGSVARGITRAIQLPLRREGIGQLLPFLGPAFCYCRLPSSPSLFLLQQKSYGEGRNGPLITALGSFVALVIILLNGLLLYRLAGGQF